MIIAKHDLCVFVDFAPSKYEQLEICKGKIMRRKNLGHKSRLQRPYDPASPDVFKACIAAYKDIKQCTRESAAFLELLHHVQHQKATLSALRSPS
jgi:hypothetical protein